MSFFDLATIEGSDLFLCIALIVLIGSLLFVARFAAKAMEQNRLSMEKILDRAFLAQKSENGAEYARSRIFLDKQEQAMAETSQNGKLIAPNPAPVQEKAFEDAWTLVEGGMAPDEAITKTVKRYHKEIPASPIGGSDIEVGG